MNIPPAVSLKKLVNKKYKTMNFEGDFKALIGTPEVSGSWLIYGESGSRKTTLSLKLMRYLCKFKTCAYIPLEEKTKLSFQQAVQRANLISVTSKVKIWEEQNVESLLIELSKPKSPDIIFIDSIQYLKKNERSTQELTRFEYKALMDAFPKKLFISISHAKNGEPKGALGDAVYYHSDVCLMVKEGIAYPMKSRYGGDTAFDMNDF